MLCTKIHIKQCTEKVLISNLLKLSSFSLPILLIFYADSNEYFHYLLHFSQLLHQIASFVTCTGQWRDVVMKHSCWQQVEYWSSCRDT